MANNTPQIRFKGFTDIWEQRKFSDVFVGLQNNTLSRADLNYDQGDIKNVHYGDVLIKYGEYIDVASAELPYINDSSIESKFAKSLLADGDIIIADTAEDETVGKCCEITNSDSVKLLSGLHTIAVRPQQKYASKFLGYYLNSSAYHSQLIPIMQGIKVTSISKGALQDTVLTVPTSIDEQGKIGECFSNIDDIITLHQRKLQSLQDAKKSMLQKMFPKDGELFPELRFSGFTDPWEQRKLSELANYSNGTGHEEHVLSTGTYELVTLKSIDSDGNLVSSGKYINEDFDTLKQGTLIMMLSEQAKGMLGMTAVIPCDGRYVLNQRVAALSLRQGVNPSFLTKAINIRQSYFEMMGAGTKVQNITKGHVENCEIFIPDFAEQCMIGSLFDRIDTIITLHQRKLEQLTNIKMALLQKMFI